jgi:hypothetical protein
MTPKYFSGVLIIALGLALARPTSAQQCFPCGQIGPSTGPIIAAIVGVAAALIVATVVVIHYSKKRAITGCVNTGANGMTVTDEKDKEIYALSGDATGVKAGDRMKFQGKKVKSKGPDKTLVWETKKVAKDFGACYQKTP